MKVVVQPAGAATAPENHVFSFTSAASARPDQEAITDVLRNTIAALKSASAQVASAPAQAPAQSTPSQSAAIAVAQAVSAGASKATETWYDDTRLKSDIDLQRSLLDANPLLRQRFNESLRDKPDSITITQFTTQFWSTRLHLLRAHAIEKSQAQGDYNVLPEIKFKRIAAEKEGEPDKLMLNLAKEQVKLIFKQYPIVREAYNDNVPKIDQNAFWSRFFMSRLLKKLKGEKITDADPPDSVFDKYLNHQEKGPTNIGHVPHFIDLQGNEQNHSQRKGNMPDETMRPSTFDKVPILRVLNNLSEKMMAQVAPADGDPHAPIGMDEDSYRQLQLRDLQIESSDNRVVLNITDQQRLLAGRHGDQQSVEALLYAKQSPNQVLTSLHQTLEPRGPDNLGVGGLSLDQAIGFQSDSDESDDDDAEVLNGESNGKKFGRIGRKSALTEASKEIISSIAARRSSSMDPTSTLGLSQSTFDTMVMTHNTTVEFLHYFWTLFLSGDGSRSNELGKLVETLDKSVDRLAAVSNTAEEERLQKVQHLKKQMQTLNERSHKRRRLEMDLGDIKGGKKAVEAMIAPTMKALATATEQYRKAFVEQSAAAAA